jgi:Tol biopolymer transport system component
MVILACMLAVTLAAADGPTGTLAYVAGAGDAARVMAREIPGGAPVAVGPGNSDGPPVWSPDGAWLAFETRRDTPAGPGVGIGIARPDGTQRRLLPTQARWNRWPAWGPQGRRIAYGALDTDFASQAVRVFDLDADAEQTWGGDVPGLLRPAWLGEKSLLVPALQMLLDEIGGEEASIWAGVPVRPEDTLLAVGLFGDPGRLSTAIFVVTPDIALPLPERVMPSPGAYVEWRLAPHPAGRKVAFESNDGGDREIFVLSHKGAFDVSNAAAADWNPVWSPDGDWLAFESFRRGRRAVYRVNPDTALVRSVARDPAIDFWNPAWSPGGQWLAYVSNASGVPGIVASRAFDKNEDRRVLVEGPAFHPAWRPEGEE